MTPCQGVPPLERILNGGHEMKFGATLVVVDESLKFGGEQAVMKDIQK